MKLDPKVSAQLCREACRRYLCFFIQLCAFPVAAPGTPFIPNWHIEAIAHKLEQVARKKIRRLIITVPPRSGKSICASVAFPAWLLGLDPTRRIIVVSYSDALARSFSIDCRRLMGTLLYKEVFSATRVSTTKDSEAEFRTTSGGFRLSASVSSTLTGRGGSFIILDDPLKAADAYSEAAREELHRWFVNTLLSRLDDKGDDCIVIVSQRLHEDDLVGFLLRQGGWDHLNLPAIAQSDEYIPLREGRCHFRATGDVLQPDREPLEVLEELRREMGTADYSAQYLQSPVPVGGTLIQWEWFAHYDRPPEPSQDRIIVSWDTALTAKELSSYSVGIILQVRGGTVFVLDVIRGKLEFPDLRRKVVEVHERWRSVGRTYELLIENKGAGMSLIQELKGINVHAIPVDPVGDKTMRMQAQTHHIEAGAVHIPRSAKWLDEFKHEICGFPSGRHNDQVDAFSQGLERAFKRGGTVHVSGVIGHH